MSRSVVEWHGATDDSAIPPRVQLRALFDNSIPEPNSGCWLWMRSTQNQGYGRVYDGSKVVLAHRAAYAAAYGPIADGVKILHRCDTPLCINPDHVFPGSQFENMRDCRDKGRMRVPPPRLGESHHAGRLTEASVRKIRADARPYSEIASAYGISKSMVFAVKSRSNWAHVK